MTTRKPPRKRGSVPTVSPLAAALPPTAAAEPPRSTSPPAIPPRAVHTPTILPHLLTADEVAELLRTTRKAVYAAISRDQIPGVVRLRRRVLFNRGDLVSWLSKQQSLSLEGHQR